MATTYVQSALTNSTITAFDPNFAERIWFGLFEGSEHKAIKLALILFTWHELVFFGRFLPYYLCDFVPALRKYKIQDTKETTPEMYRNVIKHVIISQLTTQLPMMMAFHPAAMFLGMKFLDRFPSPYTIVLSCAFCAIAEDTYHYFAHRLLHWGALYKHVHKLHHEYSAPFGIAAEYAHPVEVLFTGMGFFIGPAVLLLAGIDMHVITMAAWLAVRLVLVVDVHAGYDFPWSLRHWLPFWGGADFHDYHHMAFVGNYSSTFRWWDWIFGTDSGYNHWKAKQAILAKAKKA